MLNSHSSPGEARRKMWSWRREVQNYQSELKIIARIWTSVHVSLAMLRVALELSGRGESYSAVTTMLQILGKKGACEVCSMAFASNIY